MPDGQTQADAAQLLNISERSVRAAVAVRNSGIPELIEAVEQGKIPVSTAALLTELDEDEQREVMAGKKERRG